MRRLNKVCCSPIYGQQLWEVDAPGLQQRMMLTIDLPVDKDGEVFSASPKDFVDLQSQ